MFFHALTFAGSQGSCLNSRPLGREFKHLSRDPANVNAMKCTCMIVILAYFNSSFKLHKNALKLLKLQFCMLLAAENGVSFGY